MKINDIKSNDDKSKTYKVLQEKCKKALEHEDYGTLLLFEYAMFEDRLTSFLYYLHLIPNKNKLELPPKLFYIIKPFLRKNSSPQIKNISTKIAILKILIKDSIPYLKERHELIKASIGLADYQKFLTKLEDWIGIRNAIIHSSFSKNIEELEYQLQKIAIEGYSLTKEINKYVNKIKSQKYQILLTN